MEKQFISVLAILVMVLGTSGAVQADVYAVFIDDFNIPHDYIKDGVAGTIWDGYIGWRAGETVTALDANISREGQLYIESVNGEWAEDWNPLGPFLYKVVQGDFVATVKVTDYAGTEEEPVYNNDGGLMARASKAEPNDEAGPGEDWVSIDYFPIWGCGNFVWVADNNEWYEPGHNGLAWDAHKYLQLERAGNTFYFRTSADGNVWVEHPCSPIQRDDFDGLPLQVGLRHATYSSNTGYVAFDDFKLVLIKEFKARNPVPADKATNVDPDVNLAWTPGDLAETHDVYFGTDETAVLNASRPAGDVDGDGDVNWLDVFVVSQQWLQDPPGGLKPSADLNGDDNVNGFDFAIMAGDWGKQASDVFKGNQDNNSYYPGPLNHETTYYWRIDEVNIPNIWKGDVWSFTVISLKASEPSPPDDAECVPRDVGLLSWTPGAKAKVHLVYFGTTSPPPLKAIRCEPNYALPTLEYDTLYYWKVDEVSIGVPGSPWLGDEWSFRTVHQIPIEDPNLVGWWKLDGASCQNIALDSSGYDHHGILVGPQWTAAGPGKVSGALEFDGKDDYVELPIGEVISSLTNCTLMMWMDSKPGGSFVRAFDFSTDDPNVYMCLGPRWWYMDGMYFAITRDDLKTGFLVEAPSFDLPPGWHHVAVVINADTDTVILYYDGYELARELNVTISPNDLGVTTNNWLGRSHDDTDDYYLGSMADFRIYDYAITQEKVVEVIGELTQDLPTVHNRETAR